MFKKIVYLYWSKASFKFVRFASSERKCWSCKDIVFNSQLQYGVNSLNIFDYIQCLKVDKKAMHVDVRSEYLYPYTTLSFFRSKNKASTMVKYSLVSENLLNLLHARICAANIPSDLMI